MTETKPIQKDPAAALGTKAWVDDLQRKPSLAGANNYLAEEVEHILAIEDTQLDNQDVKLPDGNRKDIYEINKKLQEVQDKLNAVSRYNRVVAKARAELGRVYTACHTYLMEFSQISERKSEALRDAAVQLVMSPLFNRQQKLIALEKRIAFVLANLQNTNHNLSRQLTGISITAN